MPGASLGIALGEAAIAAGGQLLGGLFGDGTAKQAKINQNLMFQEAELGQLQARYGAELTEKFMRRQYRDQFKWLVEGAEKAGYNPLTVLGNQSYNAATPVASPLAQGIDAPEGWGPKVSRAAEAGFAAYRDAQDRLDPIEQERRRLENDLTEARIEHLRNEQLRAGQVQSVRSSAENIRGDEVDVYGPLPLTRDPQHQPRREVYVGNRLVEIPLSIAERNGIRRGGDLSADDISMLMGEFEGEIRNFFEQHNISTRGQDATEKRLALMNREETQQYVNDRLKEVHDAQNRLNDRQRTQILRILNDIREIWDLDPYYPNAAIDKGPR